MPGSAVGFIASVALVSIRLGCNMQRKSCWNWIRSGFTDYSGSVQAVMAVDTLLHGLVTNGRVTPGAAASIRSSINKAYAAVEEPNSYNPADFRTALASALAAIKRLR